MTTYCLDRLLNENNEVFNRILQNERFSPLLFFMKHTTKTKYQDNRNLMKELEKNPVIWEHIKENMHVNQPIYHMEQMDSLEKGTVLYNKMYDDMVAVGKYEAPEPLFFKPLAI